MFGFWKKLILGCLKSTKHLSKRILAPNIFYLLLLFHNDIYYISFIIIKKNFFQSFRIACCHLHLPCIPAWTDPTFFLTPHVFSIQMQNLSLFGTVCLVMFKFFLTFKFFLDNIYSIVFVYTGDFLTSQLWLRDAPGLQM